MEILLLVTENMMYTHQKDGRENKIKISLSKTQITYSI